MVEDVDSDLIIDGLLDYLASKRDEKKLRFRQINRWDCQNYWEGGSSGPLEPWTNQTCCMPKITSCIGYWNGHNEIPKHGLVCAHKSNEQWILRCGVKNWCGVIWEGKVGAGSAFWQ